MWDAGNWGSGSQILLPAMSGASWNLNWGLQGSEERTQKHINKSWGQVGCEYFGRATPMQCSGLSLSLLYAAPEQVS